jgi:hypothetical protein
MLADAGIMEATDYPDDGEVEVTLLAAADQDDDDERRP